MGDGEASVRLNISIETVYQIELPRIIKKAIVSNLSFFDFMEFAGHLPHLSCCF